MADNLSLDRIGRVTGSRIAGVLGVSPYRTRAQVMREMVREHFWEETEFDGNFVTEWGQEHELDGVAEYELTHQLTVLDKAPSQVTVVDPGGLFAVTPDGRVETDGAIEVKCPYRGRYTHWLDRLDYEQQCRLVAKVLGVEWVDFVVWRTEGTNISRLFVDVDREGTKFDWFTSKVGACEDTVIGEVERFLEEYRTIIDSEELSEPYRTGIPGVRTDEQWLAAVAAYLELEAESTQLAAELKASRADLEDLAGPQTTKGGGLQLVYVSGRSAGKGSVSYKKLAEAMAAKAGVELTEEVLDQFRGKPGAGSGPSWSIRHYEED